mmetsp:Transcript_39230/g.87673  ORF Transcript_39230/g.87673 Transcript_39230/m.87673 type:complete len:251 (-) Transcript_39230:81-833(-)
MPPHHTILVEGVVFIEPCPRGFELDCLKCGGTLCQGWPDHVLEKLMVRIPEGLGVAVVILLRFGADAGQESVARTFRAEVYSAGVNGERCVFWRSRMQAVTRHLHASMEKEDATLAWHHWQRRNIAAHGHHLPSPCTCSVYHCPGSDIRPVCQLHCSNTLVRRHAQPGHRALHELNAFTHSALAHGLKEGPGIEVAFVSFAEGANCDTIRREPRKPLSQLRWIKQLHPLRSCRVLHGVVLAHYRLSIFCS